MSQLLSTLEESARELSASLELVRAKITDERRRIAEESYGVYVGCIVAHRGVEYKVTEVQPGYTKKPWLYGSPRKKDGSFGTAHRSLYTEWEVVSEAAKES